jgi:hypothetical protein
MRRTQLLFSCVVGLVCCPSGTARRFTHDVSDYSMDLDLTRDGGTQGTITSVVQSQIWLSSSGDLENVHQISQGDPPMYEVKVNLDGNLVSTDLAEGRLWIMDGVAHTVRLSGMFKASVGSPYAVARLFLHLMNKIPQHYCVWMQMEHV